MSDSYQAAGEAVGGVSGSGLEAVGGVSGSGLEAAGGSSGAGLEAAGGVSRAGLKAALEAVLLLAEEPLSPIVLGAVVGAAPAAVEAACDALAAEYESQGRGFVLARVAGGYRYQTAPAQDACVERFVRSGHGAKLSAAALETLAVVAYKQPLSRHQVSEIRGVNVDGVMRTLRRRGYIAETGRAPGPGQAVLFGTTPLFLEHLGLDTVDDLPPLDEFFPGPVAVEDMERRLRLVSEPAASDSAGSSDGDR